MSARMTIKEQRHLSDAIAAMRKSMTLLCRQAACAAARINSAASCGTIALPRARR